MSSLFNTSADAPSASAESIEHYQLRERCQSGARWFYWVAALSLITSVILLAGGAWGFFIGLGVTRVVDEIAVAVVAQGGNPAIKVLAIVFDVAAAGAFALVGYFASRGHGWVFILGMVAYALDGVVFVLAGQWLAIAFHAFVLYSVYGGYRACTQLGAIDAQRHSVPPPPTAAPAEQ